MTSLITTLFGRSYHGARRTGLLSSVNSAMALYRSRTRLATLDDHLLADVGLTPKDAQTEANRPLWDAPRSWSR